MTYQSFLASKRQSIPDSGFDIAPSQLNPMLFPWQRDITRWAIRRGRAALFLDTGLGKTIQQLEWAAQIHHHTGRNVLILAPLAVGRQTIMEAKKFGCSAPVQSAISQEFVESGITVTNYEKLHKFDTSQFVGVVLDESSIIKSIDGKLKDKILTAFSQTPYRLACTATPAPNDHMELGNHAEFLGVMSRNEMLAMYFTHDGSNTSKWRLKGWAAESRFWEWMAGWSVMIRKPSDIGYTNDGYDLPPLHIHEHEVNSNMPHNGRLFATEAKTLKEQREARRETIGERAELLATLTNRNVSEPWITWCNLNAESTKAASLVADSIEVTGSMADYKKEEALIAFTEQHHRAIVSKPRIAGFGLNWQHCANMAFLGLSHSYEQFYQAIRRCYRFGQTRPVNVHVIVSDRDSGIVRNIQRKQEDAEKMASGMVEAMAEKSREEIGSTKQQKTEYEPSIKIQLPGFIQ